jgi:monoamine oxidase
MTDAAPADRPTTATSTSATSADVLVVGAGLAGLAVAERVHAAGRRVVVLEARRRVGGRTWSVPITAAADGPRVDLGAAWHWAEHDRVRRLAARLGLEAVRQHEPGRALYERDAATPPAVFDWPTEPAPSWRLVRGMQALAEGLAARLPPGAVRLGRRVQALRRTEGGGVAVVAEEPTGEAATWTARAAVVAVPPRLAHATLTFAPALPEGVRVALRAQPTWMSHSAKVVAAPARDVWRRRGWAGRVVSHAGPLRDVHDATTAGQPALAAFATPPEDPAALRPASLRQLRRVFGPEAWDAAWHAACPWAACDWARAPFTTPPAAATPRTHAAPTVRPALARPLWGGRLHLAASETAADHPGYLDGALAAATRAADAVT